MSFETPPGCATATDNYAISPNEPIPDGGVITSTISLAGVGSYLWDVVVTTDIPHGWSQDLDVFLVSPDGSRVTLTTDNGGSFANFFENATWRDDAGETNPPGPVTLVGFAPGSPMSPEEPLGALRGEDPNGDWKLEVHDDEALVTGTLVSWGLQLITLAAAPEVVTTTISDFAQYNIPDNGTPVNVTLPVEQQYAALGRVELETQIRHPLSNDLVIELIPPSGITITVAEGQGGAKANVFDGTHWTDREGVANDLATVTDAAYSDGVTESPLTPQEPFSAAAGRQPGGNWKLRVTDGTNDSNTGTIEAVTLTTASYICRPELSVSV
ncbi:MAG: proprotein convertase P-domain-containing protein, partial [Anaerolineales bacterium]